MLGIVIGVAVVVLMVAAGQTVQKEITNTFASLGTNQIIVGPAETVSGGVRGGRGKPSVTFDDVEAIATLDDVVAASYVVNAAVQEVYGSNNYGVIVVGTDRNYLDVAFIKGTTEDKMKSVACCIEYQLRTRHRLKTNAENDFTVRLMTEMVNQVRSVGTILSLLLAAIASISLVVGSIGIMNMMLVFVTERTREIGTSKALRAPNNWIMVQFLSESIIISFMGSFIGMVAGVGLSQAAGYFFGKDVPISMWSIIISISVAVVVGVVSGLMSAMKAMKLDPIEALRFQ